MGDDVLANLNLAAEPAFDSMSDAALMNELGLNAADILQADPQLADAAVAANVSAEGGPRMMIAPHREHTPPSMVADGGERLWSELQLAIKQHSVHKVEVDEATGDKLYVVSNLRKFTVEVQLLDKVTQEPAMGNQLRLRVRRRAPPPSPTRPRLCVCGRGRAQRRALCVADALPHRPSTAGCVALRERLPGEGSRGPRSAPRRDGGARSAPLEPPHVSPRQP